MGDKMTETGGLSPYILVNPAILDQKDVDSVNRLMKQLFGEEAREVSRSKMTEMLCQQNFRMIILQHPDTREVIGMASLCCYKTLYAPKGVGRVEDVVVDERYRGKGLGRLLVKYIISLAKTLRLEVLELTSNPKRVEANALYLGLGFEKYDTNVYVMNLPV